MKGVTLIAKVHDLQVCLADLQQRAAGYLVDGIKISCINQKPFINLRMPPPGFEGVVVVKSPTIKIMAAEHLGCQLRWTVRVAA